MAGFKVMPGVIVVMLLIFSIFWYIGSQYQEEEEEPPESPTPDGTVIEVSVDQTWNDVEETLKVPVFVVNGATLRIVDSEIRVLLEDLLGNQGAWFTVDNNSSLVLEDSGLTIHKAPQLDNAIVMDWMDRDFDHPSLSRVVNLVGAENPVMTLEVCWKEVTTPLVVAIQANPVSDMETLAILECEDEVIDTWRQFSVSMIDYAGMRPRLILFPLEPVGNSMMVSELLMSDGGKGLPFENRWSGHAVEDGWRLVECEPLMDVEVLNEPWGPLLSVSGDLVLERSSVVSSQGLPRTSNALSVPWQDPSSSPGYDKLLQGDVGNNVWHTTISGGIELFGARLDVTDSTIEYVPVWGVGGTIQIIGSHIIGDHDLVALNGSVGSVMDTVFESVEPSEGLPFRRENDRFLWALSLEGSMGNSPFEVRRCDFIFSELALDLTNANVELSQCDFDRTRRLAIWDHGSTGLDGWDEVFADNSFIKCEGYLYLRTHGAVMEFDGPGMDDPFLQGHGHSPPRYWGDPELPMFEFSRHISNSRIFVMPTEVTDANGTWAAIPNVTMRLWEAWGGRVEVTVDTSETWAQVVFPGRTYRDLDYLDIDHAFRFMGAVGQVELGISIYKVYGGVWNYSLSVDLDGMTHEVIRMDQMGDSTFHLETLSILNITPGRHIIRLNLAGLVNGEDDWVNLQTMEFPIHRQNESVDDHALGRLLGEEEGILYLDPGVEARVGDIVRATDNETSDIRVIMNENTSIFIDGINITGPALHSIYLEFEGPGDVTIQNYTASDLMHIPMDPPRSLHMSNVSSNGIYIEMFDQDLVLEDVETGYIDIYATDSHVKLSQLDVRLMIQVAVEDNSTCEFSDSVINQPAYFSLYASSLNVTNVSVSDGIGWDPGYGNVYINPEPFSSVNITGCTFEDSSLNIELTNEWHLNITECVFTGENGAITLFWFTKDNTWVLENDPGTIENNTFSGPGSGIISHFTIFPSLIGENELKDGARLWALYIPFIKLVYSGRYSWSTADFITAGSPYIDERPEAYPKDALSFLFRDVTDDPSAATGEEGLWVSLGHIVWRSDDSPTIVYEDFYYIYPVTLSREITATAWDDVDLGIRAIVTELNADNWWEE